MNERIDAYLNQCRIRSPFEDPDVHVPPTPDEVRILMAELQARGLNPVIVGSVAVFHHIHVPAHEYRPTADLDLWVRRHPGEPVVGWRRDETSPGVLSWISEASDGYVDFLIAGQRFPDGARSPLHVRRVVGADDADLLDLLTMKLSTMRERDLSDSIALVRVLGLAEVEGKLGRLSGTAQENWELVKMWLSRRPKGGYRH